MSYDANIYDNPEKFGLKIVDVLDEEGLSYEYNTFVVFEDQQGNLLWTEDAGCSCPYPFEGQDRTTLRRGGVKACLADAKEWNKGYNGTNVLPERFLAFERKVREGR